MPEPILTGGLIVAGTTMVLAAARPSTAVSEEAGQIYRHAGELTQHVKESRVLFGAKLNWITAFKAAAQECAEENWDGYGAVPVPAAVVQKVIDLIASLPEGLTLPEASCEPDGEVALDWAPMPQRTISISLGDTERLSYAWMDGSDRGHAVAKLVSGNFPARILDEIRRITNHESSLTAA